MATDDPGAEFKLVGGRLCLDFINTVSGRGPDPSIRGRDYRDFVELERLVTWTDLVRWAVSAGATQVPASTLEKAGRADATTATKVTARARALREAMYRVFKASIEGWAPPAAALELLNREIAEARKHEQLVFAEDRLSLGLAANRTDLDHILWPVALSAAELLTGEQLKRVTQCPGDQCGWLFFDSSRNKSRRWCDMADCGNLAKVQRFRAR
jgi:predicted RNA-binding Zn ribbon-like protein